MVNAKGVAFKVNRQTPISKPPLQPYGTVINCRKPAGKRAIKEQKEVRSHYVAFNNIEGTLKRKRGEEGDVGSDGTASFTVYQSFDTTWSSATSPEPPVFVQRPKPPRIRKVKLPSRGVDLDCWFIILSFSDPAQLLVMRSKLPSCYYFLRDNPMLWKHSRNYHYGSDLPEPPSELTEYQYANLRHDHGCMGCKAPNTRKTYWAFLRRWCKTCLGSKTQKEHDAIPTLQAAHGEESLMLQKCLPSGIFDSWGNFVGVGPATTHALKTVYLTKEVEALCAEYSALKAKAANQDPHEWAAEVAAWYKAKTELVEERKTFAHKMEAWEEIMRNDRSCEYTAKKNARKTFFQKNASEMSSPVSVREMECCPSYKRAIAIPKDPNNTSWLQLKPKLEKEVADLREKGGPPEDRSHASSASGTSTPNSIVEPQHSHRFPIAYSLGLHFHAGNLQSQSHMRQGPLPLPGHVHQGLPPPPSASYHAHSQSHGHMLLAPPPPPPPPPLLNHMHHTVLPPPHSHMF
jgi:hypothetical protein